LVEEDAYCVDVLHQAYAVERALKKFEAAILEGHLRGCVPSGIREGRDAEIIEELSQLFELARK
jgi:DNA-binding FrmR family transcriptional regulator